MLLIGLGFIAAMAVGLLIFFQFQKTADNFSNVAKITYEELIEHIYTKTFENMAEFIEKEYPVVHETGRLKEEAGNEWFWDLADEWHKLAKTFDFKYIYYAEKDDNSVYRFLMSAEIRRDYQSELLGTPVWQSTPPPFIDEAWETKQVTFSLKPTVNEWGAMISAAKPIITDGKVVGVLGIDYDVSYLDSLIQKESLLHQQEDTLLRKIRYVLIISILGIMAFMGCQLWLSNTVILVPLKEKEAEERTRLMLDTLAFSCCFFDSEYNLLECNKKAVEVFGCKDKETFIANFYKYMPEYQPDGLKSRDKAKKLIQDAFESGKIMFFWEHLKEDGTPLPVEVTLTRVEWKGSYRVVSNMQDISELVETEVALKRVLAITEASPNFTLFIGAGGNIEHMNPAVCAVSGFSQEELHRDGLALLFSPEDFTRLNGEYIASALRNQTVDFEMTLIAKDGQKRDFSFSMIAVQMYDRSTGIGIEGRDITELKRMQRDLASAKEQAESALVHEIHYNKAKNDFLSKVSHELRTPMNAIIGMTSVARKAADEKERMHYINIIDESSRRLLDIVNDILDISAINTGKFILAPQPFSFNEMVSLVIGKISPDAHLKGQDFNTSLDPQIPDSVIGDDRRIRQILIELLFNAVKFTPEKGKIMFSCGLLENRGNECTVRFEVTDSGIGISPKMQERLWDIFEQEDNSITREYDGMGLGLALTKRIVDIMKGKLRVESELGKGSRFICDIPLGVNQAESQDEKAKKTDVSHIDLTGKHVLVVDDVDINREIILALLEDSGAVLDTAQNGDIAVKKFLHNKYDLVLLDLHMPVMDGFTAVRHIRASTLPRAKTVPIISISADASPDIHQKCMEAGITDHLAKPVEENALYEIIAKWMYA